MLLDILAHVKANEFNAQLLGQHTRYFGLSHARGTDKEQRGQRFILVGKTRLRHLHGLNYLLYSLVLTIDFVQDARLQALQLVIVSLINRQGLHLSYSC